MVPEVLGYRKPERPRTKNETSQDYYCSVSIGVLRAEAGD